MTNHEVESFVRLFGMHNLMLETSLEKLEESGIEIGHSNAIVEDDNIIDLQKFDIETRNQATKMSEFYKLYYCLENTIRKFVRERLEEILGEDWWNSKVPDPIKIEVKKKQKEERDTTMTIRSDDPLAYTNFGELIDIINSNWADFADTLRSPKSVQQTLSGFNRIRNVIAHSCELSEDEILRLKLAARDWFRIQS